MWPSSFPYTLVRDFAYGPEDPSFFGPPPDPSAPATPSSEKRLSDPPAPWEQKMPWDSWTADGFGRGHNIPPISFGDGPPYSEDEDLQSPVVSTRHRKYKSTSATFGSGRGRTGRDANVTDGGILNPVRYNDDRGYYAGSAGDGRERYYLNDGGEPNGPGGDIISYPTAMPKFVRSRPHSEILRGPEGEDSDAASSPGFRRRDESRYSREYQFTITSPDEEFHGKAVALYDFERENENELPLIEGQIIWVSYRHGQGWLVAEDPKTEESGLVPEEYVRLLRDIEGGMNSLTGSGTEGSASPAETSTPTRTDHASLHGASNSNDYHQPIVSSFSTSSKDLKPYPTGQLHSGQTPPQVVHYHGKRGGSQTNTPTLSNPEGGEVLRRESMDTVKKSGSVIATSGDMVTGVE